MVRRLAFLITLAGCGRVDFGEATRLVQFSARGDHGCGRTAAGEVGCWGRGDLGQLGMGDLVTASIARRIATDAPVDAVVTGEDTSCLVTGGELACFGHNTTAQIPGQTTASVLSPVPIAVGAPVATVALGQHGMLALTEDRALRYWGGNGCAQDGSGVASTTTVPSSIPSLSGVTKIAVSDAFSCAVVADGTVWCWGGFAATAPQGNKCLGDGDRFVAPVLALEPAAPVLDIDGGCHDHICAALADGTVWCRGSNFAGQIGDGTVERRTSFVQVIGVSDAISVAVGAFHSCALRRTGEVVCWGENAEGQLGNGTFGGSFPSATATVVLPGKVDELEAGCTNTCARTGGELWCWGNGDELQLGNGVIGHSAVPVRAWAGPDAL